MIRLGIVSGMVSTGCDATAWKCYAYLHDVTYLSNLGSSVFLRNADNQVG